MACHQAPASRAEEAAETPGWRIAPETDLPSLFACLRQVGVTLVAAHRGGPADGYPENAIETFAHTLSFAPALLEIDVSASADGVLYLLHDERLERTTTGRGVAASLAWSEIKGLRLEDPNGEKTNFAPPRFDAALSWAKDRAILEVDIKPSASYSDVVKTIVDQHAENRVILIAPSFGAADKLERLLPEAMISAPIAAVSDFNRAVAEDIPANHVFAFSTDASSAPRLFGVLREEGATTAIGTAGAEDSLDREIALSGENDRYADLARDGADIIATDRPIAAAAALAAAGRGAKAGLCGISKD
ncbi:MAG TPA: glycerophosphodiester phosphodiesterase family protein [Parvularculaceae bacterium]|nr:glycerophosphodiester phosphodiesterase family protein [Parvularculaceae bacterium]